MKELISLNVEHDVKTTLPVLTFDKQHYISVIDSMDLEDITPGFLKSIKDAAIAVDKRLSAPIKAWRAVVDEIISHAELRIAELKKQAADIEEKRKADKKIHVQNLLDDLLSVPILPQEYLNNIVLKPEYLNKTMTDNKIVEDIQLQINNQIALKKGADDALELRKAKTKITELLLSNLNEKYKVNYSLSDVMGIEDSELNNYYEKLNTKPTIVEDKTNDDLSFLDTIVIDKVIMTDYQMFIYKGSDKSILVKCINISQNQLKNVLDVLDEE